MGLTLTMSGCGATAVVDQFGGLDADAVIAARTALGAGRRCMPVERRPD